MDKEIYIDTTNIKDEKVLRALELLHEIGKISEEMGSTDIHIDKDTLEFLNRMMPEIDKILESAHRDTIH